MSGTSIIAKIFTNLKRCSGDPKSLNGMGELSTMSDQNVLDIHACKNI